jgi:hypothetical protein
VLTPLAPACDPLDDGCILVKRVRGHGNVATGECRTGPGEARFNLLRLTGGVLGHGSIDDLGLREVSKRREIADPEFGLLAVRPSPRAPTSN